jgi:ABC-type cobalamin/Fe3+-siderophores transport system ATPase subunit
MMHDQGKTILLVEQNARAGLRLSTHGVVLENGRVRLSGTGHEVLNHPEIGALYLGGAVTDKATPETKAAEKLAAEPDQPESAANGPVSNGPVSNGPVSNGTAPGAAR